MKKFTLGFIFDSSLEHVLLVRKNRPVWQAGKLNGLGGKYENGETGAACIVREIHEEAGLSTLEQDWIYLGNVRGPEWGMDVFTLVYTGNTRDAQSITDEQVSWYPTGNLPDGMMTNLRWMIPFALDKLSDPHLASFTVTYT